jgi:Xaa-Pro aminopeptidase
VQTAQNTDVPAIQQALEKAHIDGWLFYSFRDSDPIAASILGVGGEGHIATRRWFYFIPAHADPIKIVHSIERDLLDHLPGLKLIYLPWQQLHQHLKDSLTQSGFTRPPRIAMQYSPNNAIPYLARVDAGTVELIRSFGIEVVSSADLVNHFESAWTPDQLSLHEAAATALYQIVDAAFAHIGVALRAKKPVTEYDIQQFIVDAFAERGLISRDPPIVAAGANSASPHYEPTRNRHSPISAGDFVLIDLWARVNRPGAVYADITWTAYAGAQPPARMSRVFEIVRDARDAAVAFVEHAFAAGQTIHGWQVDDACREVIRAAGFAQYFIHRTGHNIHTEVHGNGANIDNLETRDDRVLIPRTCFSIEPGIYLEGDFGVRSEIDVYVSEAEARVTGGTPQRELVLIDV